MNTCCRNGTRTPYTVRVNIALGVHAAPVGGHRGRGGGGGSAPSQICAGKFRCGKCRGAPWTLGGAPRQSPSCVLLVCEKFAENPEIRVGNFAVNLKREPSHANLKCHESQPPPPPPPHRAPRKCIACTARAVPPKPGAMCVLLRMCVRLRASTEHAQCSVRYRPAIRSCGCAPHSRP